MIPAADFLRPLQGVMFRNMTANPRTDVSIIAIMYLTDQCVALSAMSKDHPEQTIEDYVEWFERIFKQEFSRHLNRIRKLQSAENQ